MFESTIKNELGQTDWPYYWSGTTHANVLVGSVARHTDQS